jgi:hypothetical protein
MAFTRSWFDICKREPAQVPAQQPDAHDGWPEERLGSPERQLLPRSRSCASVEAGRNQLRPEARRGGVAPDHVICTGDIVAYGAAAAAAVALVGRAGIRRPAGRPGPAPAASAAVAS